MIVLAGAENLIMLFVGIELLSIPLYVLCATELRRRTSLEAGLKYLVIGSVGSATLLYGLALIYGATGHDELPRDPGGDRRHHRPRRPAAAHRHRAHRSPGLAFKASIAPFHQWTPDVYQGAPTPITAFMAVATKAAAFAIFLRLFDKALILSQPTGRPPWPRWPRSRSSSATWARSAQRSLKRMLAWSGVGQAGYILAGVVVGTQLGLQATRFYLAVYLVMNLAAFAVVVARERVSASSATTWRRSRASARASPWLAWPLTIAMLALAGFPATAGFIGKFYLIDASVDGDYAWLGVMIVIGSMISLGYYLRVVAVMWMTPSTWRCRTVPPRRVKPVAGWSPEADARAQPEVAVGGDRCPPRPRSSSGSCPRRCSTWPGTWARPSPACGREPRLGGRGHVPGLSDQSAGRVTNA